MAAVEDPQVFEIGDFRVDAAKRALLAPDGTREDLEAELARQSDNPQLVAELVVVQARLGNRSAALELSQRCARLAPSARRDVLIADLANLANVLLDSGAIGTQVRDVDLQPCNPIVHVNLPQPLVDRQTWD